MAATLGASSHGRSVRRGGPVSFTRLRASSLAMLIPLFILWLQDTSWDRFVSLGALCFLSVTGSERLLFLALPADAMIAVPLFRFQLLLSLGEPILAPLFLLSGRPLSLQRS